MTQDEIRLEIEKISLELTPKHLNFYNKYIETGFDTPSAYMFAYPNAKLSTARRNGYELLTSPIGKEYISLNMRLLEPMLGINKVMLIKELKNIIFDQTEKSGIKIKAIETINKMMQYDSPLEIEIKQKDFDISSLSEDEKSQILKIAENKI